MLRDSSSRARCDPVLRMKSFELGVAHSAGDRRPLSRPCAAWIPKTLRGADPAAPEPPRMDLRRVSIKASYRLCGLNVSDDGVQVLRTLRTDEIYPNKPKNKR